MAKRTEYSTHTPLTREGRKKGECQLTVRDGLLHSALLGLPGAKSDGGDTNGAFEGKSLDSDGHDDESVLRKGKEERWKFGGDTGRKSRQTLQTNTREVQSGPRVPVGAKLRRSLRTTSGVEMDACSHKRQGMRYMIFT